MKKIFLLAFVLLISSAASAQYFIYEFTVNKFRLSVVDSETKTCKIVPGGDLYRFQQILLPGQAWNGDVAYTVTAVGKGAFAGVEKNYNTVFISKNITDIEDASFSGSTLSVSFENCEYLRTIGQSAFRKINTIYKYIPATVTSIGDYAFAESTGPEGTESSAPIPDFAFQNNSMTSFEFTGASESIGEAAFNNCKHLKTLILPASLKAAGKDAFTGSDAIADIYYYTMDPVTFAEDLFDPEVYSNATLHIYEESLNKIKTTIPWKYFVKIVEDKSAGIKRIETGQSASIDFSKPYDVYNINGIFAGHSKDMLQSGVYIVRQGGVAVKIYIK